MLDKNVQIGFMNQRVREYLDDYMASIRGYKKTGKFYYVKSDVKFRRKTTNEILYGIYEEEIEEVQYIWSGLERSPAKILLKAEALELAS